jgi:hypothetical protein
MAYRLRYEAIIDWVGPGMGPMSGNSAPQVGMAPAGGAQSLAFFNAQGGQNSGTFTSSDITTLLASMSSDLSTQMNAAITRVQGFASGTD